MSKFGSFFKSSKPTIDEKLATGAFNWRLKPNIIAAQEYPNFLKFITKLENENNIQFGLHNDISDDIQETLVFRNTIYNNKGAPMFTFLFTFLFVKIANTISFTGESCKFSSIEELTSTKKEFFVMVHTNEKDDLSVEEYEKYYWEVLSQSLSVRGYNPADYLINREGGLECMYKLMEKNIRNKNK